MISVDVDKIERYNEPDSPNLAVIALKGLSSDTKPIETFEDDKNRFEIANGSSFFEIDTQNISFYDKSTDSWK